MKESQHAFSNKIDPDLLADHARVSLALLDELITFTKESAEIEEQIKNDVLKVVHCFRFIKVNKAFILYAVLHPDDKNIYTHASDYNKRLLRDLNNTAFHFASYRHDKAEQYWENIAALTLQVENAYQEMKKRNLCLDFIKAFCWDDEIGCLEARVSGALNYATRQISQPPTRIEELIEEAYQKNNWGNDLSIPIQAKYRDIFQCCLEKDLFGHYIYLGKQDNSRVMLTRAMLARYVHSYFRDILSEEDEAVDDDIHLPALPLNALSAIKLINNHQALAKTVASPNDDNQHWDFIFRQLMNPEKERPILSHVADRNQVFNPLTQKVEIRPASIQRGQLKPTPYIKKTALTLLPPDGKMVLFGQGIDNVGVLWDLTYCNVKNEKYTFLRNAYTSRLKLKLWQDAPKSVTVEGIRQHNQRAREIGKVIEHNEILAAPARQGLRAIFATNNHIDARINALRIKLYIDDTYHVNLPLLIQDPHQGVMEYTFLQQIEDVCALHNQHKKEIINATSNAYILLNKFFHFYKKENLPEEEQGLLLIAYLEFVLLQVESAHKKELLRNISAEIADFNSHTKNNKSLLHFSAAAGFMAASLFLLEKNKTSLMQQDNLGSTPLHYACQTNLKLARYFLAQGIKLDEPLNNNRESPRDKLQNYMQINQKKRAEQWKNYAKSTSSFAKGVAFLFLISFEIAFFLTVFPLFFSMGLGLLGAFVVPLITLVVISTGLPGNGVASAIYKQVEKSIDDLCYLMSAIELNFFLSKLKLDQIKAKWSDQATRFISRIFNSIPSTPVLANQEQTNTIASSINTVIQHAMYGFLTGAMIGFLPGAIFGGVGGAAFAALPGIVIGAAFFGVLGCAVGGVIGGVIGIAKNIYTQFIKTPPLPVANNNLVVSATAVNEKVNKKIQQNLSVHLATTPIATRSSFLKVRSTSQIHTNYNGFFNRSATVHDVMNCNSDNSLKIERRRMSCPN